MGVGIGFEGWGHIVWGVGIDLQGLRHIVLGWALVLRGGGTSYRGGHQLAGMEAHGMGLCVGFEGWGHIVWGLGIDLQEWRHIV